MPWTEADLEAVDRAIAAGESELTVGDKRMRLRDPAQLLQVRALIKREMAASLRRAERDWPATRRITRFRSGLA